MKTEKYSVRKLAEEFGIDRRTATKVLAGVQTEPEAREALQTYRERQQAAGEAELDATTGLSWWQSYLRERTLLARQRREAEQRGLNGDTVPVAVVQKAAEMAACKLSSLADTLYAYGVPMGQPEREAVTRAGRELVEDFNTWLRGWLEREAEIAKGK